jgi:hypothetical protein
VVEPSYIDTICVLCTHWAATDSAEEGCYYSAQQHMLRPMLSKVSANVELWLLCAPLTPSNEVFQSAKMVFRPL